MIPLRVHVAKRAGDKHAYWGGNTEHSAPVSKNLNADPATEAASTGAALVRFAGLSQTESHEASKDRLVNSF